jgi:hypothetical protein
MKMKPGYRFLLAPVAALSLMLGCQQGPDRADRSTEVTPRDTQPGLEERHDFVQEVQEDLNEIEQYVAQAAQEAATKSAAKKAEIQREIDRIEPMLEDAKYKLNELRAAGDNAWEHHKREMDRTMDSLNQAYEDLKEKV